MNLILHAENEIKVLKNGKCSVVVEFEDELINIFKKFKNSSYSNDIDKTMYAIETINNTINKLFLYENLGKLHGTDDEWEEIDLEVDSNKLKLFKNKRNINVSKLGDDNNKAMYDNAVKFRTIVGDSKYTLQNLYYADGLNSSLFIKEFPFIPKTFYVDVEKYYTNNLTDEYDYRNKYHSDDCGIFIYKIVGNVEEIKKDISKYYII